MKQTICFKKVTNKLIYIDFKYFHAECPYVYKIFYTLDECF